MSDKVEFSQEKENMILDLKDMVNAHSKTINKLARVVNSQQERIEELETKLNSSNPFDRNPFGGL